MEKNELDPAGGLAVIEGVMMRSGNRLNISVRKNNKIISKRSFVKKRSKILKLFFIRGIINMWDMLETGIKALSWSAEQQGDKDEKISNIEIIFTILTSFIFAILIFIVAPFYAAKFIYSGQGIIFNIIDGIVRVIIFIIYILLISLMKDVKRVFQYHGAEHKTVNCYEAKKQLTVENVKKFSTLHTRCGTSFIIIVLLISIIVFSFITSNKWYLKLGLRIILIPVIIGLSYEFLKLSDRFKNNKILSAISQPGLWIQKITTKEPDKKQIEVAIHSLKKVI